MELSHTVLRNSGQTHAAVLHGAIQRCKGDVLRQSFQKFTVPSKALSTACFEGGQRALEVCFW